MMRDNEQKVREMRALAADIIHTQLGKFSAVRVRALVDRTNIGENLLVEAARALGARVVRRGGEEWVVSSRARREFARR